MTVRFFAAALLLVLASTTLRAAEPAPLPPAVGLSESTAKERAALFAELAAAKSDAEGAKSKSGFGPSGAALPTTNRGSC